MIDDTPDPGKEQKNEKRNTAKSPAVLCVRKINFHSFHMSYITICCTICKVERQNPESNGDGFQYVVYFIY